MEAALHRKLLRHEHQTSTKAFQEYSRRLGRDLEGKGILRTSTEATNLAIHANIEYDVLKAECIRTFPTVTFPATLLLKREEIETHKVPGASIITAVHHGGQVSKRAFADAPFDLLYGFRGSEHDVDLLSPYEMLLHWSMVHITPPTTSGEDGMSKFTDAGLAYKEECKVSKQKPSYEPGLHYIAVAAPNRILMPELPALGTLRHRWVWERRFRLHLPVWNFSRVPHGKLSPEENARLLSVYMRPWTLNQHDVTESNVLLPKLRECMLIDTQTTNQTVDKRNDTPQKRRRQRAKGAETKGTPPTTRLSYAATWLQYIEGHIVSESNRHYIMNLLSATAARVIEHDIESGGSSSESDMDRWKGNAGSMDLVHKTLRGIAAHDGDEGRFGVGRYAASIRMGRSLWETPPLNASERLRVKERLFDNGTYPDTKDTLKAALQAMQANDDRTAPFQYKTQPFAFLTVKEYGTRIRDWLQKIEQSKEPPTREQMSLIKRVADRVLHEFALKKEGDDVAKNASRATQHEKEDPLIGLIHGQPGTGKSEVIKRIRQLFEEALEWQHGDQFLCVAFQNRMAAAIGGATLHSSANLPRPGENIQQKLSHSDVDHLFVQNESLRWILIDEVSMLPDELLGAFESNFKDAALKSRYTHHRDRSQRLFGGYNVLFFGDWWQLPPIPHTAALFRPPDGTGSEQAKRVLDIFWGAGKDSLNYLVELTEQKKSRGSLVQRLLNTVQIWTTTERNILFFCMVYPRSIRALGGYLKIMTTKEQMASLPADPHCAQNYQRSGEQWQKKEQLGMTWSNWNAKHAQPNERGEIV